MKSIVLNILLGIILAIFLQGCSDFLDVKSDKALAVPATLEDYQAILNEVSNFLSPAEGEIMSGDHYLPAQTFESLSCQTTKDMYRWMDTPQIDGCIGSGWDRSYKNIYRANVVINGVNELERLNLRTPQSSFLLGQGYFIRAINYFDLAQVWTDAYPKIGANKKLGLPLKYSSDFNESTVRSTLEKTFEQILEDLHNAAELLPDKTNSLYLPSKAAAWSFLARVYLYMHNYESANVFAEKCLEAGYQLLDYRDINGVPTFPFKLTNNVEVIYARTVSSSGSPASLTLNAVDTLLFKMYDSTDFRKSLFFLYRPDRYIFRGDYGGGSGGSFSGPSLAEMYLILAETCIRLDKYEESKAYLEEFLRHRTDLVKKYKNEEILEAILLERRKELLYRGIRFGDIKRLNVLGAGITLKRVIREQEYLLPPNDLRSTLLIPQLVLEKSGIEQNIR